MDELVKEIERVLNEEVAPMIAQHLGTVEFVSYNEGVVRVRLGGTCKGCPLAELTLKGGIEEMLKARVNGIDRVEAVDAE